MRSVLRIFWIVAILMAGCAAPIDSSLWQPLPKRIVLSEPLSFQARGVGRFTLPAGEYRLVHQNKFGYFYGSEGAVEFVEDSIIGSPRRVSFKGGLALSNRERSVIVYELTVPGAMPGELGHLAAAEAGDKDGRFWRMRGRIPDEVARSLRMDR